MSPADESTVEPTAADRAAILGTADFAWDYDFDESLARLTKNRYSDGVNLEYQYEDDDVQVFGSIDAKRSERDATRTFDEMISHGAVGVVSESGATVEPRDDLFSWGDRSRAFVTRYQGVNIGFGVLAQRGDRILGVSWLGFRVDEDGREELAALLEPILVRMAAHDPGR